MTNKEWLNRGFKVNKEINALIEQKDRLFVLATSTTTKLSSELKAIVKNGSENKFIKYASYSEVLDKRIDELCDIKKQTLECVNKIDDICYEWEQRTSLDLEFEEFAEVFQKDVNNYITIKADGKFKSKGAYVKKLSSLDYDLPIINRALVDYMVRGVPIEQTINGCDDLKEFQLVTKISGKYTHIQHGDERLKEKCIRVFASNDDADAGVQKVHAVTGRPAKMPNSPLHCFFHNDEVNGVKVPGKLDKTWYIALANKRLGDFGI